ncbi:heterokaryon incompatibility protein-domain-containing protein [Metarhizium brunneum]
MGGTHCLEYPYLPLRNKDQSILDDDFTSSDSFNIRVIEIEPAIDLEADLRCEIKHIDVSKNETFSALSYVWGPPVFSHRIYCGNAQLAITLSLDRALRRLRKAGRLRLWVDAVCINQKDTKEKDQQVQRMGQIYGYAQSTLVWLGGDGHDAEDMDKCINFFWGLSSSRHESSVTADRADASIREELMRFFGHTDLDAVRRFLASPWFTRRWVIQEAIVNTTHFYCGSLDITRHALDHAVFILQKSSFEFDQRALRHIQSLEWEANIVERANIYQGSGILDLLVRFSHTSCSDDHDRIYAYLGLANDVRSPFATLIPESRQGPFAPMKSGLGRTNERAQTKRIAFEVSYDEDVNHVYADFAERLLEHQDHLDLLHCAGAFRPHASSVPRLHYTWAPDWRLPRRYKPLINVPWFRAGVLEDEKKPFLNYPWLAVEGFVFGNAISCIPIEGVDSHSEEGGDHMFMIGNLCTTIGMFKRYITGERMWQALALTFVADHGANDKMKHYYVDEAKGKLIKRNASERDMHTLLDWWARFDEGLIPIPPFWASEDTANPSAENTQKSPPSEQSDEPSTTADPDTDRNKTSMPSNRSVPQIESPKSSSAGICSDSKTDDLGEDGVTTGSMTARSRSSSADAWLEANDSLAPLTLEAAKVPASQRDTSVTTCVQADRPEQPSPLPHSLLLKLHEKSLHRHNATGIFLKPSATAGDWHPTSYENQSGWHSRIDEELEPYEDAKMKRLARKSAQKDGKELHDTPDEEGDDSYPEDAPYDVEWRHQGQGLVWFDGHGRNEERYSELANETLRGRCFFLTSNGYFGIGPDDMTRHDTIVILHGARTPFVLRPTQDSRYWMLLGDCYVHGIMGGEAMQMEDRGLDRKFVLR